MSSEEKLQKLYRNTNVHRWCPKAHNVFHSTTLPEYNVLLKAYHNDRNNTRLVAKVRKIRREIDRNEMKCFVNTK